MRRHIGWIVALTGLAGCASIPTFDELDTNGDGAMSREEFSVRRGEVFDWYDLDHDGYLSRREYDFPPLNRGVGAGIGRGGM